MSLALQTCVFAISHPKLPFLEYQSLPKKPGVETCVTGVEVDP